MYFNSSSSSQTYAAAAASGGLTVTAMAWAHTLLLAFALAFAAFVVYRIVMRTNVVTVRRLRHLPEAAPRNLAIFDPPQDRGPSS